MFRRRKASERPSDTSVEPVEGAGSEQGSSESAPRPGAADGFGPNAGPAGAIPTKADPTSPAASQFAASSSTPAVSDPKGPAMSASTPPRTPGQGFVPEIPRRSAADIPGAPRRMAGRGNEESKRLLVGRDISLSGEITACDALVVEGTVEATLEHSQSIEVAETGLFKGKVTIEEAIIGGRFEGDLTVRGTLTVKSTGVLEGTVRFGRLEVELGGVIKGDVAPNSAE